jgi:hypothetical protein
LPDHLVARSNARTLAQSEPQKMKRKMQINGKNMHNEKRMKAKIKNARYSNEIKKKCTVNEKMHIIQILFLF